MSDTTLERTSDREIVITRTFRAPPRIVYEAWIQPEHVKRWWAPKSLGAEIVSIDADVRVGGSYRYVIRGKDAPAVAFLGKYVELSPPSRVVYTQIFEPMAEMGEAVITLQFDALPSEGGERTRMVSRERYPSKDALDAALSSGMEHGMRETLDQLDALAQALASK